MNTRVVGNRHEITLEGPISEKTTLFDHKLPDAKEVVIDMEKVTFINSIGVKNWINWSMSLPSFCILTLLKCPYVIVNQANMVMGFLPRNARIESFFAPYTCNDCGAEKTILATLGKDYDYKTETADASVRIPEEFPCTKCKGAMEPDFLMEKTFKFLSAESKL